MERFAVLVVITGFTLASAGTAVGQSGVYIYPQRGQSAAQQARDQAECERWAMEQTGYHPAAPQAQNPLPGQAVSQGLTGMGSAATGGASGSALGTAAGTLGGGGGLKGAAESALKGATEGALKGATGSSPVGAAAGALTGAPSGAAALGAAGAGSALGGAGMAGSQQSAQQPRQPQQEYQRAYAACIEGRGYTVK
jgi:hypothetical protein